MNTPGNKLSRARKPKTFRKKLNYKLLENDDIQICENLISKFSNSWDNVQILHNHDINDLIIKNIETVAKLIVNIILSRLQP